MSIQGAEVLRVMTRGSSKALWAAVSDLARGRSLSEACRANQLPVPGLEFRLATKPEEVQGKYTVAPPLWLPPRNHLSKGDDWIPSPHHEVVAHSQSLVLRHKHSLWADVAPDQVDAFVTELLTGLQKETGLDFLGQDVPRLGNLEVLTFPSLFGETPLVQIETASMQRSSRKAMLTVRVDRRLAEAGPTLVRVKRLATEGVLTDECVELPKGIGEFEFERDLSRENGAEVEVFRPSETQPGTWTLLHTEEMLWLREIQVDMRFGGLPRPTEDWLTTWAQSGIPASRVLALQPDTPRTSSPPSKTGTLDDERAAKEARAIARALRHDASGPVWLSASSDGIETLVAWFKRTLEEAPRAVLVMPSLHVAILDVLAHAQLRETALELLSSWAAFTEQQFLQEVEQRKASLSGCALRIRQMDESPVVPPCLLAFDKNDHLLTGYVFSGSGPLHSETLASKLSGEPLAQLGKRIAALVTNHQFKLRLDTRSPIPRPPKPVEPTPEAIRLEPELPPETAGVPYAEVLGKALESVELASFKPLWERVTSWLAHHVESGTPFHDFIASLAQRSVLTERLHALLSDGPEEGFWRSEWGDASEQRAQWLVHELLLPFEKTLKNADVMLSHGGLHVRMAFRLSISVRLGLRVLLQGEPSRAVSLIADALQRTSERPSMIPFAAALIEAAFEDDYLDDPSLWLKSTLGGLRALGVGVVILWMSRPGTSDVHQALRSLELLEAAERVRALAQVVYALRVRANRAGHKEPKDAQQQRLMCFQQMERDWPVGADDAFLTDIVIRCSGPLRGSWAETTSADLLDPLVAAGKLTRNQVASLWLTFLVDDITAAEAGKRQFYADTHEELTEVAAGYALGHEVPWFNQLLCLKQKALRMLERPFVRSTMYSEWRQALDATLWIDGFARLIELHLRRTRGTPGRWAELKDDQAIERIPYDHVDPAQLAAFARAIRRVWDKEHPQGE
ncbi:hypothetical protein [Archangium sp. Cb G35]|uniref:hypothetical protein n=1 Tax=Archangium sp. Cb G35 TaxID=1920190 RepID=UPI001160F62A|nr:hypothetical protein [Archangium sp. Cb G35]